MAELVCFDKLFVPRRIPGILESAIFPCCIETGWLPTSVLSPSTPDFGSSRGHELEREAHFPCCDPVVARRRKPS